MFLNLKRYSYKVRQISTFADQPVSPRQWSSNAEIVLQIDLIYTDATHFDKVSI